MATTNVFTSLPPGSRIRLIVLDVTAAGGESTRVRLRYAWTGPMPEHFCSADLCQRCTTSAQRVASRKLGTSVEGASVTLVSDGQARTRVPAGR